MPKTSSNSVRHDAVSLEQVLAAARDWISSLRERRPEIVSAGYFGSYARGDYAPGSDFDVLIEVSAASERFRDRPSDYLPSTFPVDVDLLVYTSQELAQLRDNNAALVVAIGSELRPLL